MDRIIYTKYSNERADKFMIRTDIMKNLEGQKYVVKRSASEASQEHIAHIYDMYQSLSQAYDENSVVPNRCEKVSSTELKLEFVTGKTYEELLDEKLVQKDYLGIIDMIKAYKQRVLDVLPTQEFVYSQEFEQVFGKVDFSTPLLATNVANIDLIFPNIMVEDKWTLLDYEWTFDFAVPVNFILYRAISHYLFSSNKRTELWHLDLLQLFNITEEEKAIYAQMDAAFHGYVQQGMTTLGQIYTSMNKAVYRSLDMLSDYMPGRVQVFYDYGEGFSEENSEFINCQEGENKRYRLSISNRENLKALRIDPTNQACMIYIQEFSKVIDQKNLPVEYYNNGIEVAENLFIYNTDDPQWVVPEIERDIESIEVIFSITNISGDMAAISTDVLNAKMQKLTDSIKQGIEELTRISEEKVQLSEEKAQLSNELKLANEELDRRMVELDNRLNTINQSTEMNQELENSLKLANEELARRSVEMDNRMNTINEFVEKNMELENALKLANEELERRLDEMNNRMNVINEYGREKANLTMQLEETQSALESIQNTKWYKLYKKFR